MSPTEAPDLCRTCAADCPHPTPTPNPTTTCHEYRSEHARTDKHCIDPDDLRRPPDLCGTCVAECDGPYLNHPYPCPACPDYQPETTPEPHAPGPAPHAHAIYLDTVKLHRYHARADHLLARADHLLDRATARSRCGDAQVAEVHTAYRLARMADRCAHRARILALVTGQDQATRDHIQSTVIATGTNLRRVLAARAVYDPASAPTCVVGHFTDPDLCVDYPEGCDNCYDGDTPEPEEPESPLTCDHCGAHARDLTGWLTDTPATVTWMCPGCLQRRRADDMQRQAEHLRSLVPLFDFPARAVPRPAGLMFDGSSRAPLTFLRAVEDLAHCGCYSDDDR